MQKLIVALVALLALLVLVVVALPFLVPTATYKEQIARQVEAATGRALTIDGELRLTLLPQLGLRADGVRLANRQGGVAASLALIESVDVELATWPLFRGVAEIERLILRRPVLNLEIDAAGVPNWELGGQGTAATAAPRQAGSGRPAVPLRDLRLGEVRIEDGTVVYRDARDGRAEILEQVGLSVALERLASPLSASGSLRYHNEPVTLDLALERPLALFDGGASGLRLDARLVGTSAVFSGTVAPGAASVAGDLVLELGEPRRLLRWLGAAEPATGGLDSARLAGRLEADPSRVALEGMRLALDGMEGEGLLVLSLDGERPALRGSLALGHLDLAPYLARATAPAAGGEPRAAAAAGWSDEPIVLPLPVGLDVDLALALEGLDAGALRLGASRMVLAGDAQGLRFDLQEVLLYGGRAEGSMHLGARDGRPLVEQRLVLEGVAARPLLQALVDVDRIEGALSGELALTAMGQSERELAGTLAGDGRFAVEDGALLGFNLAAMMRNIATAFLDQGAAEARRTDFALLDGSFRITGGMLETDDLRLVAPLVQVTGAGRVDIAGRSIPGLRFEPRAVASLEGQGGREAAGAVLVPVEIAGPWDDLTFRADLRGITSPEAIGRGLDRLREGLGGQDPVRDVLEGLGGMFRPRSP